MKKCPIMDHCSQAARPVDEGTCAETMEVSSERVLSTQKII